MLVVRRLVCGLSGVTQICLDGDGSLFGGGDRDKQIGVWALDSSFGLGGGVTHLFPFSVAIRVGDGCR